MNAGRYRQFLTEEKTARLQSLAIAASRPAPAPQPSADELRRRHAADLSTEEHTEGRVHRAPPAPVNYHAEG